MQSYFEKIQFVIFKKDYIISTFRRERQEICSCLPFSLHHSKISKAPKNVSNKYDNLNHIPVASLFSSLDSFSSKHSTIWTNYERDNDSLIQYVVVGIVLAFVCVCGISNSIVYMSISTFSMHAIFSLKHSWLKSSNQIGQFPWSKTR